MAPGGAPPSTPRDGQERTVRALAAAGRPTAAARHLVEALACGRPVDADLVSAVAAEPGVDPSAAADLLLAAADTGQAAGGQRAREWLLAAVEHLMRAGRLDRALRVLGDELAADRGGPDHRAVLLGRLGSWYAAGRPSLALEYLSRALAERPVRSAYRSWLLTSLASVAAPLGHPDADRMLGRAERAQRAAPSPGGELRLALARSGAALARGDLPASRRSLGRVDPGHLSTVDPTVNSAADSTVESALDSTVESGPRPTAGSTVDGMLLRAGRIANQIALGELDDARAAVRAAAAEAGTGAAGVRPMLDALGCLAGLAAGELPETLARAREALRPDPVRQLPEEPRLRLLAVVVEVLFRRGETHRARALLARQGARLDWPDAAQWSLLAGAAAHDPDPARHRDLLCAAAAHLDRSLRPLLLLPHQGPWLVRAIAAVGEPARARVLAGRLGTVAGYAGNPLWQGLAGHAAAVLDRDPVAAREAVARLRTTAARPALAEALLDLASLPGVPAGEARDAAARSAALSGRIGATGDQERALRCERDLGARVRRSGVRPRRGLEALTRREARVAELLAAGATKQQVALRLYLSFHTVDTHLRAIYAKLGIRTRVQLARAWDAGRPPAGGD